MAEDDQQLKEKTRRIERRRGKRKALMTDEELERFKKGYRYERTVMKMSVLALKDALEDGQEVSRLRGPFDDTIEVDARQNSLVQYLLCQESEQEQEPQ